MPRTFIARALALLALVVAGTVVAALADESLTGVVIGFTLAGIAAVLLVSLAFYEVGRSEDRARSAGRS